LNIAYLHCSYPEEMLFYSIIMANLYDYDQAYFDVYDYLSQIYVNTLQLDDATANLAMSYLRKAAEKGHEQAKKELEKITNSGIMGNKEQIKFIYEWSVSDRISKENSTKLEGEEWDIDESREKWTNEWVFDKKEN